MECSNCGAHSDDDAAFCPNCGAATGIGVDPLAEDAIVVSSPQDALNRFDVVLASIGRRFFARLIDVILLSLILVIPALALLDFNTETGDVTGGGFGTFVVLIAVAAAYEIGMIAYRGQTVGKIWLGIKVVSAEDTDVLPSGGRATLRYLVPSLVGLVGIVGNLLSILVYLSAVWDSKKQGWHDKAARTIVIKL